MPNIRNLSQSPQPRWQQSHSSFENPSHRNPLIRTRTTVSAMATDQSPVVNDAAVLNQEVVQAPLDVRGKPHEAASNPGR